MRNFNPADHPDLVELFRQEIGATTIAINAHHGQERPNIPVDVSFSPANVALMRKNQSFVDARHHDERSARTAFNRAAMQKGFQPWLIRGLLNRWLATAHLSGKTREIAMNRLASGVNPIFWDYKPKPRLPGRRGKPMRKSRWRR